MPMLVPTMRVWNKKNVWSKPGKDRADVKNEANLSSKQCHQLQIAHLRPPSTNTQKHKKIQKYKYTNTNT